MTGLILLAQTAATFSWVKVAGLAWPVVASIGGVIAALYVADKVTKTKLENMQREIRELERENREQRDRLVSAEKEIALSLKNIEVKLSELTAIVALVMKGDNK